MGGGYVTVFPRGWAWLVARLVPLEWAATAFVATGVVLKGLCAFTVYLFLRAFVRLPAIQASLVAALTLFVQTANFTLDTLLISSMWNMTVTSLLLVSLLPMWPVAVAALATVFVAVTIWSSIAHVAIVAAVIVHLTIAWRSPRSSTRFGDVPRSRPAVVLWMILVGLSAAYLMLGVHYGLLIEKGDGLTLQALAAKAWTYCRVLFERSFIEGVLGRTARDMLVASPARIVIVVLGTIVLHAMIVVALVRVYRRSEGRIVVWLAATWLAVNVLTALVALSGRYHDGYGAAQHYYVQSIGMLTICGYLLTRWRRGLLVAFCFYYCATAALSIADIRRLYAVGDYRVDHRAFSSFIARYQAHACQPDCRLAEPAIWSGPWAIALTPRSTGAAP
jgi:hypothetical protein